MTRLGPLRTLVARRSRSGERGQGIVELTLILPVFLMLFVVVLDLGRVAAAQIGLENAAREGAAQAAQTPTDFSPTSPCPIDGSSNRIWCVVKLEASGGTAITAGDVSVTCTPAPGCAAPVASGSAVTVRITGRMQLLTPLMGAFFGGQTVNLSASATEHREWLPASGLNVPTPASTPTAAPNCKTVPSLVGSTVANARSSWTAAGFTGSFTPATGQSSKIVVTQSQAPGACLAASTAMTVTYQ